MPQKPPNLAVNVRSNNLEADLHRTGEVASDADEEDGASRSP